MVGGSKVRQGRPDGVRQERLLELISGGLVGLNSMANGRAACYLGEVVKGLGGLALKIIHAERKLLQLAPERSTGWGDAALGH